MLAVKLTPLFIESNIFLHSVSNRNGNNLNDAMAVLSLKLFIFFNLVENALDIFLRE